MADVLISVVICTFNRAHYLRKVLASLEAQTCPRGRFEILVVDNCSTDDTRRVVEEEFSRLGNLRYVYEPVLGANQARNTGRRAARGEYVAYLDDDVITSPRWLEVVAEVFETVRPLPGAVGGRIEPIWEAPRPPWLSDEMLKFLAVMHLSEEPAFLTDRQWLMSANMAFPRKVLEEMNGFEVHMGRVGNKLLSMDENLLQLRLRRAGYRLFYHPEMAVRHHVPAARLTKRWLLRRMYWEGVSLAVAQVHQDSPSPFRRLRMASYAARQIVLTPRRLVNMVIPTDEPDRFASKCSALEQVGYMMGSLGVAK